MVSDDPILYACYLFDRIYHELGKVAGDDPDFRPTALRKLLSLLVQEMVHEAGGKSEAVRHLVTKAVNEARGR